MPFPPRPRQRKRIVQKCTGRHRSHFVLNGLKVSTARNAEVNGIKSKCSLCNGTDPSFLRLMSLVTNRGIAVVGKSYFVRQATTLLKFAKTTSDPNMAAALVDKAANLKSRVDETLPDPSPQAPDVDRQL